MPASIWIAAVVSRPFRFGFSLDGLDEPAGDRQAGSSATEDIGYSSVVMTDHFDDRHGPLVALTAIALATTSLRVGTLVLANDYRHPAVLAKELASLDQVSDADAWRSASAQGWMASRLRAGRHRLRPSRSAHRAARRGDLRARGMLQRRPLRPRGRATTRSRGLDSRPKPAQKPRPPLLDSRRGSTGCWLWPRAGPTSWVINPSLHSGAIDEHAGPTATAEATDSQAGRRCGTPPGTASTPWSSRPGFTWPS